MNNNADLIAASLDKMAERLATQYERNLPEGEHRKAALAALETAKREARASLDVKPKG